MNRPFLSLFTLLLFACTPQGSQEKTEEVLPVVVPEAVKMNPDTLDLIEDHIRWALDSQFISGAVALIVKDNKVPYLKAFGFEDRALSDTLEKDDIFRMASMTKPIVSTAIMQLYEKGMLDIHDPISKFIPEFGKVKVLENYNEKDSTYDTRPADRPITIHHLLTHTSGLSYGFFDPVAGVVYSKFGFQEAWTKEPAVLESNIPKMAGAPLMHDPGDKFTYGISIDVLGRIVEIVSGKTLEDYLKENIFHPLNMIDTHFYLPDEKSERLVKVWYTENFEPESIPESFRDDYPVSGAKTYFSGGAGLVGTAMDYAKFATALLNKGVLNDTRILKEETVDMMFQNQIDTLSLGPGVKFGYGGEVNIEDGPYGRKPGRWSWSGYWQTLFWIDQERNLVGILLTNTIYPLRWSEIFNGYEDIVNKATEAIAD